MAAPGGTSALIAAFAFGIVVNGASAALFLNVKGHGSTIFRDGLRLALTTFLLGAALWAQIGFITTAIDVTSASSCSIASIFTALFDQLARYSIEQFMLWGMGNNKSGAGQTVLQVILVGRFIAGGVFVGFVRRQERVVCAPTSSLLPVSVVVVALDAIIIVMLAARAFSVGLVEDARSGVARSKAIVWILIGFAIWSATSVTLLLGMPTMDLVLRTALPAAGLTLLLIIVAGSIDSFSSAPRQRQSRRPESPRRDIDTRDISTAASEAYPPMRYEDLKREEVNMSEAYLQSREAPTGQSGASRGMAQDGAAVIGRHGVPIQGALFPPLRSDTELQNGPRQAVAPQPGKKSLFDGKGGPAAAVTVGGKFAISQPILAANSEMNPLNKIPTMDLAAAAQQDKERREMWTKMQRESTLIASRPAPKPPGGDVEEGVVPATMLSPMHIGSAKTSSAQLSPGGEELRRRSPRQSPDPLDGESGRLESARFATVPSPLREESSPPPAPKSASEKPRAGSPPRQKQAPFPVKRSKSESPPRVIGAPTEAERANMAPAAGQFQAPLYVSIRPSRQATEASESAPEPQKTTLQRRPTIGLPGNPRARAMTTTAAPAEPNAEIQKEQTIMFVKDITYDDPSTVQRIIDGANTGKAFDHEAHELEFGPISSNSVVNRPRPIPRKPEKDRVIFPTEASPNLTHRRTKSGGSIASRKSILQAYPGSPTQLPPLPPPPKSAGGFSRPHPNDTRSMTFDEKMRMFYPSGAMSKRRSSVPDIPAVPDVPPSNFFDVSETETQIQAETRSRATWMTKSSFKMDSVLDVKELSGVPGQGEAVEESVRSTGARGEVDSMWIAGMQREEGERNRPSLTNAAKRASSPVLPPARESLWAESVTSGAKTPTDAGTTVWGSVHSPAAAVNIQRLAQGPRSTYIHPRQHSDAPPVPLVPAGLSMGGADKDEGGELIPMVLDTLSDSSTDILTADSPTTPVGHDEGLMLSNNVFPSWHKRVGDDLLTFSERKEKMRSRMPPPTPLLLRAPSTRNPVVVKAAEPSPLESPDHALQLIQAQLQRIDQPNRDSVGSQGTRRLELLENLEKEMDQWRHTKHDMLREARDSLSTIRSSPSIDSRPGSLLKSPAPPPVPPKSGSIGSRHASMVMAERRAARRELLRSASNASSKSGEASQPTRRPASSVHSVGSSWQHRLAEAQTEYAEHAPELLATRKQSFFALAQMGSPTPPDTDESDHEAGELSPETRAVLAYTASSVQAAAHKTLWTPATQVNVASASLLWSPPRRASDSPVSAFELNLPVTSAARTLPRKADGPLGIESNKLWQQSRSATKRYSSGLWQPRYTPAQPSSSSKRPLSGRPLHSQKPEPQPKKQASVRGSAIKPPRHNRRITALPDILESPQPLPDKRGTLGIFQFPWGETSDSATVQQPRQTMFAMPGTMTSGGGPAISAALEARSRQFEAAEYSSSFFDDYDDDDLLQDSDDEIEDEDSGDEFDETTLWEIASLLKTDKIPTKNRTPPQALATTSSFVDDYMDDASDLEEADEARESIIVGLEAMVPEAQPMEDQELAVSHLWTAAREEKRRSQHGLGLPHPDADTWRQYDAVSETLRAQPRQSEFAPIESDELWQPATQQQQPKKMKNKEVAVLLWSARNRVTRTRGDHGKGVAQPDAATWSLYDTVRETVRALPRRSELMPIESDTLWRPADQQQAAKKPQPTRGKLALMWSPRPAPKARGEHGKGVAQPDEETWRRYDAVKETIRALPRQSELVPVESDELWQPMSQRKVKKTQPTKSSLMWSARPTTKARGDHGKGVAYPDAATWGLYDAVKETIRAVPRQSELRPVESDELWRSSAVKAREPNWIMGPQPVKMAAQSVPMWTATMAATQVKGGHGKGVAQPDAATWSLYDTVRETARSQPRQSDEALVIESDNLWQSSADKAPKERNWIKGSQQVKMAAQSVSMWTATSVVAHVKGEHGRGIAQPDAAMWSLYDTVRETARSQPRQSDEALVIESANLWQPASQNKTQAPVWILAGSQARVKPAAVPKAVQGEKTVLLWSVSTAFSRSKGDHGKGVAQPDAATWALYDTVRETARSKPRQSEEPLPIQSDRLWQPAGSSQSATGMLWTASIKKSKVHGKGLPQPDEATWRLYDATKETARAKARPAEPATIESTYMWISTPPESPKEVVDWSMAGTIMSKKPASPATPNSLPSPVSTVTVTSEKQVKTSLWTAAAPVVATMATAGLFQVQPKAVDTRTTPASPAALGIVRKARSPELKPLDRLASTDLWAAAAASANVEINWIAMGQTSPSAAAAGSSSPSPRSARTAPLKATPADWNLAVRQATKASYPPEWMPRLSASGSEWAAALEQAVAASRISPMAGQRQAASLRPSATPADWALALSQAVSASYPGEWMPRLSASGAEWAAALEQAVAASAYSAVVEQKKTVSRPSATPADWALATQRAVAASYPSEWMPRWAATASEWDAAVNEAVVASAYPVAAEASEPEPQSLRAMSTADFSVSSEISGAHEAFSFAPEPHYEPQTQMMQQYAMPDYQQYQGYATADPGMYSQQFQDYATPYANQGYVMPQQQATYGFSGYAVPQPNAINQGFDYGFDGQTTAAMPAAPQEQDTFIMSQIEALEQERMFAEQMLSRPLGMGEAAAAEAPVQAPQPAMVPMPLEQKEPQAEPFAHPVPPAAPAADESSAPKGNRVTLLY